MGSGGDRNPYCVGEGGELKIIVCFHSKATAGCHGNTKSEATTIKSINSHVILYFIYFSYLMFQYYFLMFDLSLIIDLIDYSGSNDIVTLGVNVFGL